jgi:hypothetical protein
MVLTVKRWKISRESLITERTGGLRIHCRVDAAPFSVVVSHFSPVGFDELQVHSRIRERSIRLVGFEADTFRFL